MQYTRSKFREYLFNVADIDDTIGKAAEASMREVIGKSKIDEALTTGKAQISMIPRSCSSTFWMSTKPVCR